jgi:hypothetical protein
LEFFRGKDIAAKGKAGEGLSDFDSFYFEGAEGSFDEDFIEESFEVDETIGEGVCKGDNVIFVGRSVFEVKAVVGVVLVVLPGYSCGAVGDVVAAFGPSRAVVELMILRTVSHLHAFLVKRTSLGLNR